MSRHPNPTDCHVGARVRMKRHALGMSQTALGAAVGVTFQQIQKYEKGTNRIGASRLKQFSTILREPPAFFFAGMSGEASSAASGKTRRFVVDNFIGSRDGIRLAAAFMGIGSKQSRRLVVAMAERFAAR